MVHFADSASVFIGVVCLVVGRALGLPALYYILDGLFCLVGGVLILVFSRSLRAAAESAPAEDPEATTPVG